MMIVRRMVMILFEKEGANHIYCQRHAGYADRLIKMNCERNKETMDGFPGHEQRDHREHDGAGEPTEDADFACPEAILLVGRMPARKIVGNRRDEERGHMRAHVPAIGQQRHRVRKNAGGDFDHHHHAGDGDDDAGAAFAFREVAHEIVRMPKPGMV